MVHRIENSHWWACKRWISYVKTEAKESNWSLCNDLGEEINKELSQSAAEIGIERRDE